MSCGTQASAAVDCHWGQRNQSFIYAVLQEQPDIRLLKLVCNKKEMQHGQSLRMKVALTSSLCERQPGLLSSLPGPAFTLSSAGSQSPINWPP